MSNQNKIILITIGFLSGIIFSANYSLPLNLLVFLIITGLFALASFFVKSRLSILIILIIGFCIGLIRQQVYEYFYPADQLTPIEMHKNYVVGRVTGDVYRDQYGNNNFLLENISINEVKISSEIKIKTFSAEAKEGQKVLVYGKIRPALGKTTHQISNAKVTVLDRSQPILIKIKSIFVSGIKRSLPEPSSSFIIGILIGARSTLPKMLQDDLITTGLAHIVAVSGYNLTIITGFLDRMLKGKWKWGSLVLSLWLILGFTLITGASASIVRAAIMSAIFLVIRFYGRKISILSALCLTAIITCLFNPSYLINDLGWQLSFLSLSGIVLFTPKIENKLPKKFPHFLKEIIAVSIAAQIATYPLIAYKFGQISLISPIANILIMPVIPFMMLFGFITAIFGSILSASVASTLSYPFAKFLELIIDMIKYLSDFNFASMRINNPSILSVLFVYFLLIILALMRTKKSSKTLDKLF